MPPKYPGDDADFGVVKGVGGVICGETGMVMNN